MPEKHFIAPNASIEPENPGSPARNLLAAVLCRSLMDLLNPIQSEGGEGDVANLPHERNAAAWFRSNKIRLFSFCWICQHLDLSPNKVRQFIKEAKERGQRFEPFMNKTLEAWEVKVIKERKCKQDATF